MTLNNATSVENEYTYKSAVWLWKIVSPILITVGTCGNILTILVLTRIRSRITSTYVYLSALATSDILALNTGLLRQWIKYAFDVDVRIDLSEAGCKCHWFIVYVVTQFSSWMLVCVTVERCLSTWFPHRRSVACNTKSALTIVVTIAVCLAMFNSHYLFGYGNMKLYTNNETELIRCVPQTHNYEQFIIYEWTWIDLCVFYLIPMVMLVSGNTAIVYKVIDSQRKSRRVLPVMAPSAISTVTAVASRGPTTANKTSGLTITLVVVSGVFILCITPIVVYPIGEPHWKQSATPEKLAQLFMWETMANILMYANHSVNFVLYFLSGSKFRNEVKRLLCSRCMKTDPSYNPIRSGTLFQRSRA